MDGTAKGTYNDQSLPDFNVNLSIANGKIKYPSLPSAINNIQVKANIKNPDGVVDHTVVDVRASDKLYGLFKTYNQNCRLILRKELLTTIFTIQ